MRGAARRHASVTMTKVSLAPVHHPCHCTLPQRIFHVTSDVATFSTTTPIILEMWRHRRAHPPRFRIKLDCFQFQCSGVVFYDPRRMSEVVLFWAVCVWSISYLSDLTKLSYNCRQHTHYESFGRAVCVRVCMSARIRSVEIYCSYLRCLLVTYVADKSLASSHVKVTGEGHWWRSRSFFGGFKITW